MATTDTPASGPGSVSSLREANEERLLAVLRPDTALSQAEIARRTGLSAATVSNIVRRLQAAERVSVAPTVSSGRRAVGVRTAGRPRLALAVDFGHRHLRVACGDLSSRVLAEAQVDLDVDLSAAQGMDAAARLLDGVLETAGAQAGDVIGVGMGVPGPVDMETGVIGSSAILPGWVGLQVGPAMEERLDLPVAVDNDANLGALAETRWGAGRGSAHVAYIKVATGVGAGLVLGGRLYRGHAGTAGEIGHVVLEERGELCRCGNRGCLETLAGGPALLRLLATPRVSTLPALVAAARAGDAGCRRVVADAGRAIGVAAAGLCNLLSPEVVVVGGHLARAGDLLLDPLRSEIDRYAIPATARRTRVRSSALGGRAELLGALALVLDDAAAPPG